jgi:GxxExxY protein
VDDTVFQTGLQDKPDKHPENPVIPSKIANEEIKMDYEELTRAVIGCAYRVYNTMGYGFLESVYEKCLMIELKKTGIQAASQEPITVQYEGETVGEFVADILIEGVLILELKSVKKIIQAHEVQLVNYLVATGKEVGLILNFSEEGVEVRRKVRSLRAINGNPDSKQSIKSCNPVEKEFV